MTLVASTGGEVAERRTRVEGNRVACSRIGWVELDRCVECLYLVRLEDSSAADPATAYVICSDAAIDAEVDFGW